MRPARGERGATLVEYALLAALVALVAAGSAQFLAARGGDKAQAVGTQIGTPGPMDDSWHEEPPPGETTTTTTTPASSTTTTTSSTTTTTTTTTTSTTTTTTTTTPPTTTTTTRPVTTTTAPRRTSATFTSPVSYRDSRNENWGARSTVTVRDAQGQPVAGATVRIRIVLHLDNGSTTTQEVAVPLGSTGTATLDTGAVYPRSGNRQVNRITATVVNVTVPPGQTWDGARPTVTAYRV